MTDSPHARANVFALLILMLSAAIMLWLFWHYPLGTAIATVVVLLACLNALCAFWIVGSRLA